jgi:serine phosphatase RsbU (regulator of sigma subunit)/Flp pilus assembly protein TadD
MMRGLPFLRAVFFTFPFFAGYFLPAQDKKHDSLLRVINFSRDSVQKARACLELCRWFERRGELKDQIGWLKKTAVLSSKIKDTTDLITSLVDLGQAYASQGASSAAISKYYEAFALCEASRDSMQLITLYSSLGAELTTTGEFDKAREYLVKGLEGDTRRNNKNGVAGFYNNLGILNRKQGNYEGAISYYNKAIDICTEMGYRQILAQTYNNVAYVYSLLGNQNQALADYEKSLVIARELNDKFQEELVLANIAVIYLENKNYPKAEELYLDALKKAGEIDDAEGLKEAYEGLSRIALAQKKTEKALNYILKYEEIKKQLDESNNAREKQREQLKFEYEKEKLALIKEQEKHDLIEQAKRKRQQFVIASVSVCLLIVAIFLFLLYKRFQLTHKQKLVIEEQKHLVEEKQKEILDSINYAKRIQDSLFDNFDHVKQFFNEAFLLNKPKDIVSGDFYWISSKRITENKEPGVKIVKDYFFIAVCDSTGHGVPGGFMSLLNSAYLSEAINEKNILEPNMVFDYVRERLIQSISKNNQKDGFDGMLLRFEKLAKFENENAGTSSFSLSYSAAHNAPVLLHNGQQIEMEHDSMPVGYGERKNPFKPYHYPLSKNDVIYMYTDGYADQFGGPKGKKFKYRQLEEILLQNCELSMEEQKITLEKRFNEWRGSLEQVDDVCIIGIRL